MFIGEQQPLERWEFCIQTMQRFMGFGLAVLLQNHAENFNRDVEVVSLTILFPSRARAPSMGPSMGLELLRNWKLYINFSHQEIILIILTRT